MKAPKKIALLGFDCALTSLVRMHIQEGIAPTFKKVFENGTVADNCLVPFPTITPPNWTAMATGAWPGTNNVTDFWRHRTGTTPEGLNCHNSFNWDYVKSESFWEAAEKVGKKSVIMNYPMSYNVHKKLKHGTVVGGGALTPGFYMDQNLICEMKGIPFDPQIPLPSAFSGDFLVTTDQYPGATARVKFMDADGWKNVDKMGDDPLEASFTMPYPDSFFDAKPATWYVLVRDLGKGYDTVTLSATKDFKDAYFTIKTGEWSHAFDADGLLANGSVKKIRMKSKLISLDDDATNFRLYLSHALNTDGELWCYPQAQAAKLNKGDNIATNNCGMGVLSMGWGNLDMWMEMVGIHYDWLADTATALMKDGDWDIFYSHAHPTDYIYHLLMTELDEHTCKNEASRQNAWRLHRELYKHADRYLSRLLQLFDDDTLVVLISDHGATPDGPALDMMKIFEAAGLCKMKSSAKSQSSEGADMEEGSMEGVAAIFDALLTSVDPKASRAIPARMCYAYVNLKGRDPEGIVEPEDYEKVQREIIDTLMTYVDPRTGTRPFCLALPKKEAMMMGLWGEQCGDVVYAVWPEFSSQHGAILPTASYGIGDLRTLCVFYGPKLGIKKGFNMQRVCNIVDLVPTFCYLTGWPLPKDVEGGPIYQVMDDMNFRPEPVKAK